MLIFDTLEYAKELQAVGVPIAQSEVHARTLRALVANDLATKQDLKEMEIRLTRDIELVRRDMKELELQITEVRKEITQSQVSVVKWIVGMGLTVILSSTALIFSFVTLFVKA